LVAEVVEEVVVFLEFGVDEAGLVSYLEEGRMEMGEMDVLFG
jgi:hypothetical protein